MADDVECTAVDAVRRADLLYLCLCFSNASHRNASHAGLRVGRNSGRLRDRVWVRRLCGELRLRWSKFRLTPIGRASFDFRCEPLADSPRCTLADDGAACALAGQISVCERAVDAVAAACGVANTINCTAQLGDDAFVCNVDLYCEYGCVCAAP